MSDPATQHLVDELLAREELPLSPEQDCPYLPDRQARHKGFSAELLDPDIYHALMNRGFRRSGKVLYQPNCAGCQECTQTRIAVHQFEPNKSQRRVWRKNQDLHVAVGAPLITEQKWRLYRDYLEYQHDGTMGDTWEDLYTFLYDTPVHTIEICYRLKDVLIGVSLADQAAAALSSVYMFFDPTCAERSLGTYSVLWEIDYCRRQNIPFYYLGFYVKNCTKMEYKGCFTPQQRLSPSFEWIDHPSPSE